MSTSLDSRVAEELRAELGRQSKSKRWMAATLGESPSTMNRWLNGQTTISLDHLDAMCQALGITIADLLSRIQPAAPAPPPENPGGVLAGNHRESTLSRLARRRDRNRTPRPSFATSVQVAA